MNQLEARSWPDDVAHESNYENNCLHCGSAFIGHKRRVVCRVCSEAASNPHQGQWCRMSEQHPAVLRRARR
jgi:hypothetical protein